MTTENRFNQIQQTAQAFGPHYQEAMQELLQEADYQRGDWFVSFLAFGIDPAPLTAVFFNSMYPYTNIKNHEAALAGAMERGYLETYGDGYILSDRGRYLIEQFYKVTGAALTAVIPWSDENVERLAELLSRVVEATTVAREPIEKPQFLLSRRSDPGADAAPLLRADQYLTDLIRYRDDAHIAAWEGKGADGRAWEAFTAVWREQATTAAALAERFAFRGHDAAAYEASLQQLTELGWIKKTKDGYAATKAGDSLRQNVEALTDRYYFVGWSALNEAETRELDALLLETDEQLTAIAAEAAAATRRDLWPLLNAIPQTLFPLTKDATGKALEDAELTAPGHFFSLLIAKTVDPDPISGQVIQNRFPYANPEVANGRFAALEERGYVEAAAGGGWRLTANGREALVNTNVAFFERLAEVEKALPAEKLQTLVAYLERVANACRHARVPNQGWSINHSFSLVAADLERSALGKLDNYIDDLNAFRDDAHLSAFAPHEISGHGWELFTFLWRGDAANPAEMAEKMGFRGYDEAAYTAVLQDLIARGWVEAGEDDAYKVTAVGDALRQEVDAQTDRYFYLPWLVLNDEETADLRALANEIGDALKQMAETAVA